MFKAYVFLTSKQIFRNIVSVTLTAIISVFKKRKQWKEKKDSIMCQLFCA